MKVFSVIAVCMGVCLTFAQGYRHVPMLDGRVIGGQPVEIEQYPYQVSLQRHDAHICGATIIAERFVLTAAHCTDGTHPSELSVRIGATYHARGGEVIRIQNTYQHEDYDSDSMANDITVLELANAVSFNAAAQPAPLASSNPREGNEVIISGWGRTLSGNPDQLQAAVMNVMNHQQCVENYKDINDVNDDMFCAAAPRRDACQGDSGGPLMGNGELVGVVSWGYGCAQPQYPGVYVSVANLREFIRKYAGV